MIWIVEGEESAVECIAEGLTRAVTGVWRVWRVNAHACVRARSDKKYCIDFISHHGDTLHTLRTLHIIKTLINNQIVRDIKMWSVIKNSIPHPPHGVLKMLKEPITCTADNLAEFKARLNEQPEIKAFMLDLYRLGMIDGLKGATLRPLAERDGEQ
jgi:hypothetical protein